METLPAIEDIKKMAAVFVQSGFFKDTKDIAQASVKIMAGAELGISPIAAMRGIDIVEGQISIRAHLMGAMIKRSGEYNYRILESTSEKCIIQFFEDGKPVGDSEFTMDDAKQAGLTGKRPWQQYPRTMLYNRAMSQGARQFCPDLFLGAVYYEGEIEEVKGRKTGVVAEVTEETFWSEKPVKAIGEPENIKETDEDDDIPEPATKKQEGYLLSLLHDLYVQDGDKRDLISRVYPLIMTKESASEDIEQLKSVDALPKKWINPYVKMLRERNGIDGLNVQRYILDNFSVNMPQELNGEEQRQLIDWLSQLNEEV